MRLGSTVFTWHMQECFQLTTFVIERDAYALEAMPLHFTAAVELKKKNELFLRAHRYKKWFWPRCLCHA